MGLADLDIRSWHHAFVEYVVSVSTMIGCKMLNSIQEGETLLQGKWLIAHVADIVSKDTMTITAQFVIRIDRHSFRYNRLLYYSDYSAIFRHRMFDKKRILDKEIDYRINGFKHEMQEMWFL